MNKWVKFAQAILVPSLFIVAACESTQETDENAEQETVEEEPDALSVVENIEEALDDAESYSVRLNSLQKIDGETTEELLVGMDLDATMEPAQLRGDSSMEDREQGRSREAEIYFADNRAYTLDTSLGYWEAFDEETDEIIPSIFREEVALLKEQAESVELNETNQAYQLTLELDEEALAEVTQNLGTPYIFGDSLLFGSVDSTSEEGKQSYTLDMQVDKETYLPQSSDSELTGEVDQENLSGEYEQVTRSEMLSWNEIDEIEEPDDLDQAFESQWEYEMGGEHPADEARLEEVAESAQELESYVLDDRTSVSYRGSGLQEEQDIHLQYNVLADHSEGHIEVEATGMEEATYDIYLNEDILYYSENEEPYQELPNDLDELGMNQEVSTMVSALVEVSEFISTREEEGQFIATYEGEDPEVFQAFIEPFAMEFPDPDGGETTRLYMAFDQETGYLEHVALEMEYNEAPLAMFVSMELEVSEWNQVEPDPIPEEVLQDIEE